MTDQRPTRDSMSIEEATISNMWEIAAIVELLAQQLRTLCSGTRLAFDSLGKGFTRDGSWVSQTANDAWSASS